MDPPTEPAANGENDNAGLHRAVEKAGRAESSAQDEWFGRLQAEPCKHRGLYCWASQGRRLSDC